MSSRAVTPQTLARYGIHQAADIVYNPSYELLFAEETRADASREAAAGGPLGQAIAAVRTPVYAYVGANDLAIQAVSGLVNDLRRRAEDAVSDAQSRVTERVSDVQNRLTERVTGAQERVSEVPERVQSLPAEVEVVDVAQRHRRPPGQAVLGASGYWRVRKRSLPLCFTRTFARSSPARTQRALMGQRLSCTLTTVTVWCPRVPV